ncbi:MAG: UvrD-helicase domain-containing protein, partial [Isosphaeraceae bacterium]|nr:UvrD-helicase domain-containing protein [Isosphaeraceae bacterium]
MSSDDSELELTAQQTKALEVRGASVALGAGAGCGKTVVLTERYLIHLNEADDLLGRRAVVALTFTEKAARELRDRIRQRCRQRLKEGGNRAKYWRNVLRGLEAAPVGTFHSFCGQVLRRYAIEAGIDPGFAVLEESIAPALREQALADCLRHWLATGNDDLTQLAVEFGLATVREALSTLLSDRLSGDLDAWAHREPAEIVAAWERTWEDQVRPLILRAVIRKAEPVLALLRRSSCSHPEMQRRAALLLERIPVLEANPSPLAALDEIREAARVQGAGMAKHWPDPELYQQVKEGFEALRDAVKAAKEAWRRDLEASIEAAALGLRFARLAAEARTAYGRAKRASGMLDFDDLLIRTRDLLRDGPSAVREEVARSIGLILVDEFQDTDPIQGEILELLAGPHLGSGLLYLVGDGKQSIYRFRGARPRIFQDFRERFPAAGRLELTKNFRSAPGLIAFVNALFATFYPGPEDVLEYGPEPTARPDTSSIELLWAHEPGPEGDARANVDQRRKVEARWIARHLARRLAKGWPIWDSDTKEIRLARAGDVVILFRTLNDAAPYESALAAEGLDYYVQGGSAFFAQQEVLDLINLLSAIEDPTDSVALAGVLRSPFFGLSDEGLFWLATAGHGDLARGLERWAGIGELSAGDRLGLARAQELLTRWRSLKDRVPIATLIDRALDESGYEAALLGEPLGARKRANCRKLVRQARRYDLHGGYALADFVARLRADLRKPPREDQAATTDEQGDAVRLMTIHQAKGLEFPIVVVADLNRDAPISRLRVAFHPDLGLLVNPAADRESPRDDEGESGPGRSLGWSVFRHLERAEEEAEALRLFYVATTRARDALILSAGMAPTEPPKSPALRLLDERFDRATGACRASLPEGWILPRVRVLVEPPPAAPADRRPHRRRPRLLA